MIQVFDKNGNLLLNGGASIALGDGEILVGNSSNVANEVVMNGDASIDDTGAVTVVTSNGDTIFTDAANSIPSATLRSSLTDETGSGVAVFANTPTLITPELGVAKATSINKVTITTPAVGSTLTIIDGVTAIIPVTGTVYAGSDGATAPGTNSIGVLLDYYGTSATRALTTPNSWGTIKIGATTYKIPLYT